VNPEEIGALFLAAAMEGDRWNEALTAMADATRSSHGQLVGFGLAGLQPFNRVTGFSESEIAHFAQIDDFTPEINFRIAASNAAPPQAIVSEEDYERAKLSLTDDRYVRACEEYGIPFGIQTELHVSKVGLVGLSVLRSRADGVSTLDDRDMFARIAPHARTALQLQMTIEDRGVQLLSGSLAALKMSAFLVDGFGRVAAMTPEGEALLQQDRRLRLKDGRFSDATSASRLIGEHVDKALTRAEEGETSAFAIPATEDERNMLKVRVSVLPRAQWSLGFEPRVIVKFKPVVAPSADVELLRTAFGFTVAEAQVASFLLQDMPRSEIATARGVAFATVDAQLRSIYAKVGVSRETSLLMALRNVID